MLPSLESYYWPPIMSSIATTTTMALTMAHPITAVLDLAVLVLAAGLGGVNNGAIIITTTRMAICRSLPLHTALHLAAILTAPKTTLPRAHLSHFLHVAD